MKDWLKGKRTVLCAIAGAVLPHVPKLLPPPYSAIAETIIAQNADWIITAICGGFLGLRTVTKTPVLKAETE